jgi:Zn-dependent protease
MRDPMAWAFPIFRAFGIPVKIHVLFLLVTIGLFLRQVLQPGNAVWWVDVLLFTVVLLFGIIVLHEFGHCFGGRSVGGEAHEILIWPLGGLASVDVPHNPRAHLITVASGPAVNVGICLLATIVLAGAGYYPNLNPFSNPYISEVKNYQDGRVYTSEYGANYYKPYTTESLNTKEFETLRELSLHERAAELLMHMAGKEGLERAVAPSWVIWTNRVFWISWVLLLLNLLPAYPLDGGQLLQGFIWARTGNYRQGITVAAYAGYGAAFLILIGAIATNETLLALLAIFIFYSSMSKLHSTDAEEGLYGDFSQGYLSLERDDPPTPRPKRGNLFRRWLQARAVRRMQREAEQQVQDEDRFDKLLEKIHTHGKASLTEEEQRFMRRMSEKYKNK